MLLEGAEAPFKRLEHRLRQLRGLTRVKRVLERYALANDMALQFGDVPIGLDKMFLFLTHGYESTTTESGKRNFGGFSLAFAVVGIRAARVRCRLKIWCWRND
jgi:hypothetical protein